MGNLRISDFCAALSLSFLRSWMRKQRGRKNLDQPVHILVLVGVHGSTILRPADRGFGDAAGLTGQSGLHVDCDRDVGASLSDRRRHWNKEMGEWLGDCAVSDNFKSTYSTTDHKLADPLSCVASRPDLWPYTGSGLCRSPERSGCVTTHPSKTCTCEGNTKIKNLRYRESAFKHF